MTGELEEQLRTLTAVRAIEQVLAAYCRAIDRLDLELLKSVYHPDGVDDHGIFNGNAHEFAEMIIATIRTSVIDGMHTVTHSSIDVQGKYATAESYYLAYQRCPGGEGVRNFFGESYAARVSEEGAIDGTHDYFCGGRYIDLFERRNDAWKILRRRITNEWNVVQPSGRITDQGVMAQLNLPGRRDRSDPVYANKAPTH